MQDIIELYWLPDISEARELTIWQDESGLYGWCWKNRAEHEGLVSIDAARTAAFEDAATRWPGLTRMEDA